VRRRTSAGGFQDFFLPMLQAGSEHVIHRPESGGHKQSKGKRAGTRKLSTTLITTSFLRREKNYGYQ
jgi:hypothetical protein